MFVEYSLDFHKKKVVVIRRGEVLINRKVIGSTPVGSTWKFLFPSMPVSLTENIIFHFNHQA